MVSMKTSSFAAIVTSITLVLQLLILYMTHCNFKQVAVKKTKLAESGARLPNGIHLFEKPVWRRSEVGDSFAVARSNRTRRLTIGIPTKQRRGENYFSIMFETMLNKTSGGQLKEIVFVIFLSDTNVTWKQEMTQYLNRKYQKLVDSGSVIVIDAPLSAYNSMPYYKNDSYMTWRVKQNYDYAFMMKYSQYLSKYYMQMEDDVITSDDYYPIIMKYIQDLGDDNWACAEFSELGFIGKLYHSRDISRLADMLLLFNATQPVDYTFIYFNILAGQGIRLIRKPTLFQHIGVTSSLEGKIQLLKDKFFDFPPKKIKGDNPEAMLLTTLQVQPEFPPELAYSDSPGFFWSKSGAEMNDTFTVVFKNTSYPLTRVVIVTGGKEHPGDIIYTAVVEASPDKDTETSCSGYLPIGNFRDGVANITTADLKARVSFKTQCLRIRFVKPQHMWVIIRELAVFT